MNDFNRETNKEQKQELKWFLVFLFALCFFLFVCLLSECIPSNFICSHHSKNLLLTLTNKLFAAHKENTNYYLLKLYCL